MVVVTAIDSSNSNLFGPIPQIGLNSSLHIFASVVGSPSCVNYATDYLYYALSFLFQYHLKKALFLKDWGLAMSCPTLTLWVV